MAFTPGNDINILSQTDAGIVGAGAGNDVYILEPSQIAANQKITISDGLGANTLRLVGGLEITSSVVAGNTAVLTLSNGAVITILNASTFGYQTGGNVLTGTGGLSQTYAEFVTQSLGVAAVPGPGQTAQGTGVTVKEGGGTTVTNPTLSYALSASSTTLVEEGKDITFTITSTVAAETDTVLYVQIGGSSVGAITTEANAADFSAILLPVTIPAGSTGPITVSTTVTLDNVTEGPEGFSARLLNSAMNVITGVPAVIGTITEGVTSGRSITLTTNADSGAAFTGTSGDDTFVGVIGSTGAPGTGTTLNPGDNLVGGDGNDTLLLSISGDPGSNPTTLTSYTLTGIERLEVNNFDTSTANSWVLDLSLADTALKTVSLQSSSVDGDLTVATVKQLVDAEMHSGSGDLTINYLASVVAGAADSQKLTLGNQTAGTFTANGIETFNVVSGTAASAVTLAGNALKTITVSGDKNLNIGILAGTVTKVDASAFTGALTLAATSAVDYDIVGGSGNDVISVTVGNLSAADTINAGTGTDTLKINAPVTAANAAHLSGFEVLEATANNVGVYDVSALNATANPITKLVASAVSGANDITFANVGAAVTDIQVTGTEGVIATLKADTAADAITVTYGTIGAAPAGVVVAGQTTLNNHETISLVSQGGNNSTGNFTASSLHTLNVSGDKQLTLGTLAGAVGLSKIDASGLTGTAAFIMNNNVSDVASTILGAGGSDTLFGGAKADSIEGGAGNDSISGGAGNDIINGGAGNDTINGGAGADNLSGGDGDDLFQVTTVTDFTNGLETVSGGAGNDTLSIEQNVGITVTAANLAAISSIEILKVSSQDNTSSITLTDAVYTANGNTSLTIVDGDLTQGALSVNAAALTSANSIQIAGNTTTGVNDTLIGGAGNDTFTFAGTNGLQADDTVTGGAGTDTIVLTASADVIAVLNGVTGVEKIVTSGTGGDIVITVGVDGVITANSTLTVDASSSTTAGNELDYDGSAIVTASKSQHVTGTVGEDSITGGAGNDVLVGGDGADLLNGGAGIDSLVGGVGNDIFAVNDGAHFIGLAAAETVIGGSGDDTLTFTSGAIALNATDLAAISSIETISFANAATSSITLNDAVFTANGLTTLKIVDVTSGTALTVNASSLSAANSVAVTASGGNGISDSLVGGAGNDSFTFSTANHAATLESTDTVNGGAGYDTLILNINGVTSSTAATLTNVSNIEKIAFTGTGDTGSVGTLTLANGNFASVTGAIIDGSALTGGGSISIDAAAEAESTLVITGTLANDTLIGGQKNDTITGGLGDDSITGGLGADILTGGTGADVFAFTAVAQSSGTTIDEITDFTSATDKLQFTLDYSATNGGVVVNGAFTTAASGLSAVQAALTGERGQYIYDTETSRLYVNVNGDANITALDYSVKVNPALTAGSTIAAGDVSFNVTGGTGNDTITGSTGVDTLVGGNGDDRFVYTSAALFTAANAIIDIIDGGAGTGDAIYFNSTGAAITIANTVSFARATGVEKIEVAASSNAYSFTLNADAVTAGITHVDLSGDTNSTGSNIVDLSAYTVPHTVTGSAGNDTITLGNGNADGGGTIVLSAGPDAVYVGGTGKDTLKLVQDSNSTALFANSTAISLATDDRQLYAGGSIMLNAVDEFEIIDASGQANTAVGLNLTGNALANTIIGGAGSDTITGGLGADTINLSAGGNDRVVFGTHATNGQDTILNFVGGVIAGNDQIDIRNLGDGNVGPVATISTAAAAQALADNSAYIVNTNGQAANLTTDGVAIVTDFTDLTTVAAYLTERFLVGLNTEAVFVVNDTRTGANTTYVYSLDTDGDGNATIEAAELALVGVISHGGTGLVADNVLVDGI